MGTLEVPRLLVGTASRLASVEGRPPSAVRLSRKTTAEDGRRSTEATVLAVRETANTAHLEVETQRRAFLVMSVTPHKYWRITVDGAQVPAVITNVGYQGVAVPAGRHRVEMRYRNTVVATGVKISVAASLLLLGAVLLPRRRSSSQLAARSSQEIRGAR